MKLITASAAISFAKELEDKSTRFYEALLQKYPQGTETLLPFVQENNKHKTTIDRAYYGVISDALEGCFSFEDIDTDHYPIEAQLPEGTSYTDALTQAISIEEKIMTFYTQATEASRSLMADVPRTFEKIAKKRGERIKKLKFSLEKKR
jgi:hypothetical protein